MEVVQDGIFEPLRGEDLDVRGALEDESLDIEYRSSGGGHDDAVRGILEGDLAGGPLLFPLVRGLVGGYEELYRIC